MSEENKKLNHRIAQLEDDLEEEQNEALRHIEKSKKLGLSVSYNFKHKEIVFCLLFVFLQYIHLLI